MALHNQILLLISLSFLVFQLNIATPTPAPAPTPISDISSSPNGSPPSSPSTQNVEIPTNDQVSLGNKESVNHYVDSLMEQTMSKTEDFIGSVVEKRLSDPAADPFTKDCLLVCKEVYENAVDAMKKTIEDVNRGSYYSANVDLSALTTDLETCMDCIKETNGDDQEFFSFDDWAGKIADDALEKIVSFSS